MPIYVGNSSSQLRIGFEGASYTTGNNLAGTSFSPYYSFSAHTFTAGGTIGRTGPSLATLQSAYTAATWSANTSFFNVVGSGIQKWLVPKPGTYKIQCAGAPGSRGSDGIATPGGAQGVPGNGIIVSGQFYLNAGEILYILVGQQGIETPTAANNSDTDGGAGGGTFVARRVATSRYYFTPDSCYVTPLVVAGGGGGGSSDGNGAPGVYASWQGTSNWANIGNGGWGLGGGFSPEHRPNDANLPGYGIDSSFNAALTGGTQGRGPGYSFLEGGVGGYGRSYGGAYISCGNGGFGGGGGATDEYGAGGGGWFGGLCGDNASAYSSQGGTSYISPEGSSPSNDGYNVWASQSTNGYCTITFIA